MHLSSRLIGSRRAWTVTGARGRVTVRFAPWGTYATRVERDARWAFCVSLPFVAVTFLRTR